MTDKKWNEPHGKELPREPSNPYEPTITPNESKKIVKKWLEDNGFNYQVRARTVSFSDLGYGHRVFVKVVGWEPDPKWESLENLARKNGFRVES